DHRACGHGALEFAQHLTRMQPAPALPFLLLDHVEAVRVPFMRPLVEFLLPRGLLGGDLPGALDLGGVACKRLAFEAPAQRLGRGLRIAVDADRYLLDQAEV